jgi:hypothetical protein
MPSKKPPKLGFGPAAHVGDGVIARVVERPDGTGFVETWDSKAGDWVKGGATFGDFFFARPVPRRPPPYPEEMSKTRKTLQK